MRTPNPEWIEALLSGKYGQGRNVLRDEQGNYCCLGVGLEVLGVPSRCETGGYIFGDHEDGMRVMPNHERREQLGLEHTLANALASLNDTGMVNFEQIGKFLRSRDLTVLGTNYISSLYPDHYQRLVDYSEGRL